MSTVSDSVVQSIWKGEAPRDLKADERMQAYVEPLSMLERNADALTIRLAYWRERDGGMLRQTYREATDDLRIGLLLRANARGAIVQAIADSLRYLLCMVRPPALPKFRIRRRDPRRLRMEKLA